MSQWRPRAWIGSTWRRFPSTPGTPSEYHRLSARRGGNCASIAARCILVASCDMTLTLGTDSGSAFTARAFKLVLWGRGIARRRGGYATREPGLHREWFSKLKERCIWREEFETLDEARETIGRYIDRYHHRPHQELAYRTPREVAASWKDHHDQSTPSGLTVKSDGVHATTHPSTTRSRASSASSERPYGGNPKQPSNQAPDPLSPCTAVDTTPRSPATPLDLAHCRSRSWTLPQS